MSCFICLEQSSNNVCKKCDVKAHPSCWKKYVDNETRIEWCVRVELIERTNIVGSIRRCYPKRFGCPICRDKISNNKVYTRSDTLQSSICFVNTVINVYLSLMQKCKNSKDRRTLFYDLCMFIKKYPWFFDHEKELKKKFQDKLINYGMNIVYFELFKTLPKI